MLDICEQFAVNNSLIFNSRKSVAMVYVRNRYVSMIDPRFVLGGHTLSSKTALNHLGLVFDMYNKMWNLTSRLVVKIRNLPKEWDNTPQVSGLPKSTSELDDWYSVFT